VYSKSIAGGGRSLARIIHETLYCGHREHPIFVAFSLRGPRRSYGYAFGPPHGEALLRYLRFAPGPRATNLGHSLWPRNEGL